MAKLRKKKKSPQFNKQNCARRKNQYLKELKLAYGVIGCSEAFALIPKSQYDILYDIRFYSPCIEKAYDQDINETEISNVKFLLLTHFDNVRVPLKHGGNKLTLTFIFTHIFSIRSYYKLLKREPFPGAEKVIELIERNVDFEAFLNEAFKELEQLMYTIGIVISQFDDNFYWLNFNFAQKKGKTLGLCLTINLYKQESEKLALVIDGNKRTVYKVGLPVAIKGIQWASIKANKLNGNCIMGDLPYQVYIQSHALNRFYERLDCLNEEYRNFCLNITFFNPDIIHFNKRTLVEFKSSIYKLGYFVIDIHKGLIVVRTFLFITNSGTPEGEKLEKICGLKKQDKKYWAIDKLSTFKNSDIADNPELKNIFVEAGCGDLFALDEKEVSTGDKHVEQAQQMLQYMRTGEMCKMQAALVS